MPLPGPEQSPDTWKKIFERDKAYWDKLVEDFMGLPAIPRNPVVANFVSTPTRKKRFLNSVRP